jgi:hypothetical protein
MGALVFAPGTTCRIFSGLFQWRYWEPCAPRPAFGSLKGSLWERKRPRYGRDNAGVLVLCGDQDPECEVFDSMGAGHQAQDEMRSDSKDENEIGYMRN